jgi:hypothetical protein
MYKATSWQGQGLHGGLEQGSHYCSFYQASGFLQCLQRKLVCKYYLKLGLKHTFDPRMEYKMLDISMVCQSLDFITLSDWFINHFHCVC